MKRKTKFERHWPRKKNRKDRGYDDGNNDTQTKKKKTAQLYINSSSCFEILRSKETEILPHSHQIPYRGKGLPGQGDGFPFLEINHFLYSQPYLVVILPLKSKF